MMSEVTQAKAVRVMARVAAESWLEFRHAAETMRLFAAALDDAGLLADPAEEKPLPLTVGDRLYGFCGGFFGRDSYADKIVEAIGPDWVVAREDTGLGSGSVQTAYTEPFRLVRYRTQPAEHEVSR